MKIFKKNSTYACEKNLGTTQLPSQSIGCKWMYPFEYEQLTIGSGMISQKYLYSTQNKLPKFAMKFHLQKNLT